MHAYVLVAKYRKPIASAPTGRELGVSVFFVDCTEAKLAAENWKSSNNYSWIGLYAVTDRGVIPEQKPPKYEDLYGDKTA